MATVDGQEVAAYTGVNMAKIPDNSVFNRINYVVQKGERVVWPELMDDFQTTKEQAEEAAIRIGGVVVPCHLYKVPPP